jgi:hypothetical protein
VAPDPDKIRIRRSEIVSEAAKLSGSQGSEQSKLINSTLRKANLGGISLVGSEIRARAHELKVMVGDLKKTNDELNTKLDRAETHRSDLHQQLKSAEDLLDAKKEEIKKMQIEISHLKNSHSMNSAELQKAFLKLKEYEADKNDAELKYNLKLTQIKDQEKKISELESEIEKIKDDALNKAPEVKRNLDKATNKIEELIKELEEAKGKLESSAKESHKNISHYKEFVEKLLGTIKLLEDDIRDRDEELEGLTATFNEILNGIPNPVPAQPTPAIATTSTPNQPSTANTHAPTTPSSSSTPSAPAQANPVNVVTTQTTPSTPKENYRFKTLDDFRKSLPIPRMPLIRTDLAFIESEKKHIIETFEDRKFPASIRLARIEMILNNLEKRIRGSAKRLAKKGKKEDSKYLREMLDGSFELDAKGEKIKIGGKFNTKIALDKEDDFKRNPNGFISYVNEFIIKPLYDELAKEGGVLKVEPTASENINHDSLSDYKTPIEKYHWKFTDENNPEVLKNWRLVRMIQKSGINFPRSPAVTIFQSGIDPSNQKEVEKVVQNYQEEVEDVKRKIIEKIVETFPEKYPDKDIGKVNFNEYVLEIIDEFSKYVKETGEYIDKNKNGKDYKLRYFNTPDKDILDSLVNIVYPSVVNLKNKEGLMRLGDDSKLSTPTPKPTTSAPISTPTTSSSTAAIPTSAPAASTVARPVPSSPATPSTSSPISPSSAPINSVPEINNPDINQNKIEIVKRIASIEKDLTALEEELTKLKQERVDVIGTTYERIALSLNEKDINKVELIQTRLQKELEELKKDLNEEENNQYVNFGNLSTDVTKVSTPDMPFPPKNTDPYIKFDTLSTDVPRIPTPANPFGDIIVTDPPEPPTPPTPPEPQPPTPPEPQPPTPPQPEKKMYRGPNTFDTRNSARKNAINAAFVNIQSALKNFESNKSLPAFDPEFSIQQRKDELLQIKLRINEIVDDLNKHNPHNRAAWEEIIKSLNSQYAEVDAKIKSLNPSRTSQSRPATAQSPVQPRRTETRSTSTAEPVPTETTKGWKKFLGDTFKGKAAVAATAIGTAIGISPSPMGDTVLVRHPINPASSERPASEGRESRNINGKGGKDIQISDALIYNPKQNVLTVTRTNLERNPKELIEKANPARILNGELNLNQA